MKGAENEPVRNNPTVRSKFDKSHGKGLKAPHMSFPGGIVNGNGKNIVPRNSKMKAQ